MKPSVWVWEFLERDYILIFSQLYWDRIDNVWIFNWGIWYKYRYGYGLWYMINNFCQEVSITDRSVLHPSYFGPPHHFSLAACLSMANTCIFVGDLLKIHLEMIGKAENLHLFSSRSPCPMTDRSRDKNSQDKTEDCILHHFWFLHSIKLQLSLWEPVI